MIHLKYEYILIERYNPSNFRFLFAELLEIIVILRHHLNKIPVLLESTQFQFVIIVMHCLQMEKHSEKSVIRFSSLCKYHMYKFLYVLMYKMYERCRPHYTSFIYIERNKQVEVNIENRVQ